MANEREGEREGREKSRVNAIVSLSPECCYVHSMQQHSLRNYLLNCACAMVVQLHTHTCAENTELGEREEEEEEEERTQFFLERKLSKASWGILQGSEAVLLQREKCTDLHSRYYRSAEEGKRARELGSQQAMARKELS